MTDTERLLIDGPAFCSSHYKLAIAYILTAMVRGWLVEGDEKVPLLTKGTTWWWESAGKSIERFFHEDMSGKTAHELSTAYEWLSSFPLQLLRDEYLAICSMLDVHASCQDHLTNAVISTVCPECPVVYQRTCGISILGNLLQNKDCMLFASDDTKAHRYATAAMYCGMRKENKTKMLRKGLELTGDQDYRDLGFVISHGDLRDMVDDIARDIKMITQEGYVLYFAEDVFDELPTTEIMPDGVVPEEIIRYTDGNHTYAAYLVCKSSSATEKTRIVDLRDISPKDFLTVYPQRRKESTFYRQEADTPVLFPFTSQQNNLSEKECMRIISLNDLIRRMPAQQVSLEASFQHYPYLHVHTNMQSPLFAMFTADNGSNTNEDSEVRLLDKLSLVFEANAQKPYIFNPVKGPVWIDAHAKVYDIDTDTVLPEYLLLQLYQKETSRQYILGRNGMKEELLLSANIYIPMGDGRLSKYTQMTICQSQRKQELEMMMQQAGATLDDPKRVLPVGHILNHGDITILEHIADGGFGKLYKVRDGEGKVYALKELFVRDYYTRKTLTQEVVVDESFIGQVGYVEEKFQKEMLIQQAICQQTRFVPEIVGDIFTENNTKYYLQQYIEGDSLFTMCSNKGMELHQAVSIIAQAAIALHYAHMAHYLHLDISPANILVNKAGDGMLIDFGNAKHYDMHRSSVTSFGRLAMTSGYSAPEVKEQRFDNLHAQTDIYSLAMSLYTAVTGVIPNPNMDYYTQAKSVWKNLKEHDADLITDVITKAINPDYRQRYSSVIDFLDAIPNTLLSNEMQEMINSLSLLPSDMYFAEGETLVSSHNILYGISSFGSEQF